MYYSVNPVYRLCGYLGMPNLLYHTRLGEYVPVSASDMELLKNCSGMEDVPATPELERLCRIRVLNASPVPFQEGHNYPYVLYQNRFFRSVEWAITAGCNLNCRHCFVARDERRSADRFSLAQAKKMIRELANCGIREVHLTGGEPLTHPDLLAILEEIKAAGLVLVRIVTNGLLADERLFRKLRELNQDPEFTVSFDGFGHHDWLRNTQGIERTTLDKIHQITEAGFDAAVQMNLFRGNLDSVWDTVQYFENEGAIHMRLIRTSEAPRWEQYVEQTLTPEEYYDFGLDFIRKYINTGGKMSVCIWQFLWYNQYHGRSVIRPIHMETCSGKQPACCDARENFFIGASGEISPCIPISGGLLARGVSMGNVHQTPLRELLSDSALTRHTLKTLDELFVANARCRECPYREACGGGCRAVAYGLTNDFNGHDPMRCVYFFGGYYQKVMDLMREYGAD